MAREDEIVIKITPDTKEAEAKLAKLAIVLTTLEARTKRLQDHVDKLNETISRKETGKRG